MADAIDAQTMLARLAATFPAQNAAFGTPFLVRAPGRINLIGEHTDYNAGFVLPAAIDLEIRIALVATNDRVVEIELVATEDMERIDLEDVGPARGEWIDYCAGVARSLINAGLKVGGFKGVLASTLPMSSGLSSSAALELASAWALISASGPVPEVDQMTLAGLCQKAENEYVGVNSGLMDQFAVSCGVADHALLLDCRSLEYRPVAIPDDIALVVVDTGAPRRLVASEYNERRAQCERGVAFLAARGDPVRALRDATVAMLDEAASDMGAVINRRCRHVVEENGRALAAVPALERGDRAALREIFTASHASLRDLYEVSSPALDAAVAIADATPGVIGSRMTGAGFGGCTVNLVERDAVAALESAIAREYRSRTGLEPRVFGVTAVDGAGIVS